MILRRISATAAALSLLAGEAQATPVGADQGATSLRQGGGFSLAVSGEQGTTLINQGGGFAPAVGTTELKPGDRVMVRKGGTAESPDDVLFPSTASLRSIRFRPATLWLRSALAEGAA